MDQHAGDDCSCQTHKCTVCGDLYHWTEVGSGEAHSCGGTVLSLDCDGHIDFARAERLGQYDRYISITLHRSSITDVVGGYYSTEP